MTIKELCNIMYFLKKQYFFSRSNLNIVFCDLIYLNNMLEIMILTLSAKIK